VKPSGILLVVIGVWIAAQVLGGNAMERLNLIRPDGTAGGVATAPGAAPLSGGGSSQGVGGGGPGDTVSQKQGTKT
jgi:hypothetical protein